MWRAVLRQANMVAGIKWFLGTYTSPCDCRLTFDFAATHSGLAEFLGMVPQGRPERRRPTLG